MISSKIELPSLPRSGPARAGRQDGDMRKAPAFDDALREQGEPATAVPEDATKDAADAPDSVVAVSPTALDVLIAQMLPQQQAATPAGGTTPSVESDQPVEQGSKTIARQVSPDTGGKALPLGVQPDVASMSDMPVIELPSDRDLRVDSRTTRERNQAPEPVLHDDTPSPTSAAELPIPPGAPLASNTIESPLRARRMEKAGSPLLEMRGAKPDPAVIADQLAPIEDTPDAGLPAHEVRLQLNPAPMQQAPDQSAAALEKQAVEPARGPHARGDAVAPPEFRRVVLGKVEMSNHFAVAADPVRQIAGEVARAFETPGVAASPEMPQDAVKTISVQLEPESLGAVTLRMRLSGSNLQVRVDVAEPATLDLIQRERDRLQKSMTSDHVSIERLEIRAAGGPAPVQSGDGANAPKQDTNAPGQQPRQNSASHGGEARRENRSDSRQLKNGQDNDSARGNVSRGVYL